MNLRYLLSLITFPGVIAHEFAHKTFCELTGVRVNKVVYFQFKDPAGYVSYEEPCKYHQTFLVAVGPIVINSLLAILLSFLAAHHSGEPRVYWTLLWLAFSIGCHAFPSNHDMGNISESSKAALKRGNILHLLVFPLIGLVWLANKLRYFLFDAVYALVLMGLGGGWI